ncbi:hypothetical protein ERIC1_1c01820 [Paenibacillus larvae subsp. larvae DSM 25719]|uniref:Uncharacterized protein n=1 Tax=Paenibacillus larvae subsp. larvae DSM 25430 TaxID=697284 RepID=V9W7C5_9BACL|nr:hypothetical protein ERIC2_c20160 [Paenibacillus larvae subsp. larvae DSM 25430]ETK26754.1 hypothetical protein ERIC1_1c01820 [Paenibacillus larvae subsp. larvae DSM 25719]
MRAVCRKCSAEHSLPSWPLNSHNGPVECARSFNGRYLNKARLVKLSNKGGTACMRPLVGGFFISGI